MKMDFLRVGARGTVLITDYRTVKGECKKGRETRHNIEVLEVRSRDFIVKREGIKERMFCQLPTNKRDGSQSFWLTEDGNGFVRHFVDTYQSGNEIVESRTETVYQF